MKRWGNELFGPKNGTHMPDKTDPQATILHTAEITAVQRVIMANIPKINK